jgi:hypothetical protein
VIWAATHKSEKVVNPGKKITFAILIQPFHVDNERFMIMVSVVNNLGITHGTKGI